MGPDPGQEQERVHHGWYQWVGMALFGQSFTFYIGHFLWKSCEGRRVERLVSGQGRRFCSSKPLRRFTRNHLPGGK